MTWKRKTIWIDTSVQSVIVYALQRIENFIINDCSSHFQAKTWKFFGRQTTPRSGKQRLIMAKILRIFRLRTGNLVKHISNPQCHRPVYMELAQSDTELSTQTCIKRTVNHKLAVILFPTTSGSTKQPSRQGSLPSKIYFHEKFRFTATTTKILYRAMPIYNCYISFGVYAQIMHSVLCLLYTNFELKFVIKKLISSEWNQGNYRGKMFSLQTATHEPLNIDSMIFLHVRFLRTMHPGLVRRRTQLSCFHAT